MSTIRVLIADDHSIFSASLRMLLETQEDFELVGDAADGKEAVALATRLKPNVVLMDAAMPGLGGIEATSQISSAAPKVRVIALSQYTDREAVLGMLEAGAHGFVTKTSKPPELFAAIRAVAAGRHYLSPDVSGVLVSSHLQATAAGKTRKGLWQLTPKEREVAQLMAEGHTVKEAAQRLDVSPRTVETHRQHIMRKLQIRSVAGLTKWAVRQRLTDEEP